MNNNWTNVGDLNGRSISLLGESHLDADYAAQSRSIISEFVRKTARGGCTEIAFSDEELMVVEFHVVATHWLECQSSTSTYSGISCGEDGDLVADSATEYEKKLATLRDEALGAKENLDELLNAVSEGQYGRFSDKNELNKYFRHVYLTYDCKSCNAEGKIKCSQCSGNGYTTCMSCNGTGHNIDYKYSCAFCFLGRNDCHHCKATGKIACSECDGHGDFTDIGTVTRYVLSSCELAQVSTQDKDVLHALRHRADLPAIEITIGVRTNRTFVKDMVNGRVIERTVFKAPIYRANVAIGAATFHMVVFGKGYTIANTSGFAERFVQSDLDELQDAQARMRWYNPLTSLHALRVSRRFMESEVHQAAIDYHLANYGIIDFNAMSAAQAGALPPDYLEKAITCLSKISAKLRKNIETVYMTASSGIFIYALILLIAGTKGISRVVAVVVLVASAMLIELSKYYIARIPGYLIGGRRMAMFSLKLITK